MKTVMKIVDCYNLEGYRNVVEGEINSKAKRVGDEEATLNHY
jgi:hypothetical protein